MSEIDQADRSKRHWVLVEKVSTDVGKEGLRFIEIPSESQTLENGTRNGFSRRKHSNWPTWETVPARSAGIPMSGYTQICYSYTSGDTPNADQYRH